jgi:regulator of RNase E activity RraB
MSVIEKLLETAHQDTQLLIGNNEKGDDFSIPRDVDFLLTTDDADKANTVASFINDNNYGVASVQAVDDTFRIQVVVHMATTQNLICSVSALMACIGKLFNLTYDGWGCVLQNS